jgi:fused signal recognition particle receptor
MAFFNKIKNLFSKPEEENTSDLLSKKNKLNVGLEKTKSSLFDKISRTVVGKSKIDEDDLDDIEEILITSDIGVETTLKIIEKLESRVEKEKYINSDELYNILKNEISSLLISSSNIDNDIDSKNNDPYVIMVVGVNGVGKTTTIGKLAYKFKKSGLKVVLGAADTFRAAAIDQLVIWADRVGVEIVKQDMGSDPASVAFDTLQSAKSKNADVVIIDTAGRLHNKVNLMNELAKIKNVMNKVIPNSPHDVMLVLDASTGQNAIEQAKQFSAVTQVNSLALTKLDGTAKGGVVIGISDQLKIPVKYIGVGEALEDLQIFNKEDFVDALFTN